MTPSGEGKCKSFMGVSLEVYKEDEYFEMLFKFEEDIDPIDFE